jgi:integrase
MRLTAEAVKDLTLPPGKTDVTFTDDSLPPFGVRLRSGSAPSYVFRYRFAGKHRNRKIGLVSGITFSAAKLEAAKLYSTIRQGTDPQAAREKVKAMKDETFGAMVPVYIGEEARHVRPSSLGVIKRRLLIDAKPLHSKQVTEISRRDVSRIVTKITETCGPSSGNQAGLWISSFMRWCVRKGFLDHNPVAGFARNREAPRERVLTDDELRKIWAATGRPDQLDADAHFSSIIRLLLLTGLRRAEVGGLMWSEVDLDKATIVLPPSRMKTGIAHTVPLSAAAIEILEAQPRGRIWTSRRNILGRDHVFGVVSNKGYTHWDSSKTILDAAAAIDDWRIHDLRRTVSTKLNGELAIAPHVVEHIMAHAHGGQSLIARTYNRASYEGEKRKALDMWAEHLLSIVESRPSKVVAFPARARRREP